MAPDEACEHDMLVLVRWQVEGWPSPSLNSTLSIQTNQPLKPSVTGITGLRRATISDSRTPTKSSRYVFVLGNQLLGPQEFNNPPAILAC